MQVSENWWLITRSWYGVTKKKPWQATFPFWRDGLMESMQELSEKRQFSKSLKIFSFPVRKTTLQKQFISRPPFCHSLMIIIYFLSLIIVIMSVYFPYDLRKKLRIFTLEKTVYQGIMMLDFSYPRGFSRWEEVESNSIVPETVCRTTDRKHEQADFGTVWESTLQQLELISIAR